MVVSLATDKGVWDAVLANDQIKEFRKKLREAPGTDFIATLILLQYTSTTNLRIFFGDYVLRGWARLAELCCFVWISSLCFLKVYFWQCSMF